jgi:hypothetical protein
MYILSMGIKKIYNSKGGNVKQENILIAIRDTAIGCLLIIGAIVGLVLIGDFIFSLIF